MQGSIRIIVRSALARNVRPWTRAAGVRFDPPQPKPWLARRNITQHSQEKRQRKRQKQKREDPFHVLGLKASDKVDYNTVKRTFLQIAMQHHPDTTNADTEQERDEHRDIFVAARKAFERIVEGPDGLAVVRSDETAATFDDEEALNEWFHQESGGLDMPFMDLQTRKEVSRVMEEIGGGLDRDGGTGGVVYESWHDGSTEHELNFSPFLTLIGIATGMWTLARMVANDAKNGGDGSSLLRLEAGDVRSREINGILRRRRKRS